jgi:hypothetical protein
MKKSKVIFSILLVCLLLGGCGAANTQQDKEQAADVSATVLPSAEVAEETGEAVLADGTYLADFKTDSSMFHVNEAYDGKGTLTVENGVMTIHISLGSKKILNLYLGLAEDANKEGATLLMPTTDTVTYSDGTSEEVYGFDVPVLALDEEFDLALVGTKGTWYDHKVSVSNPEPLEADVEGAVTEEKTAPALEDGEYTIELTFEGGSGKSKILSPATVSVSQQAATVRLEWSSPNYDYMLLEGEKYLPVNTEGNSVFELPVTAFDEPISVIGDTVAMSTPHEISYTITFHSDTLELVR